MRLLQERLAMRNAIRGLEPMRRNTQFMLVEACREVNLAYHYEYAKLA